MMCQIDLNTSSRLAHGREIPNTAGLHTMNKVTGILLLCTAITSMAAGSSAWYAIPDAAAVARQATIRNNRLNQLVRLLRSNDEKDLGKFPEGINLWRKTPSNDKDKMENEDFNEWVNDLFSSTN